MSPCGSRCRFHDAAELGPDGLKAAIVMEFMVRLVARHNIEGSGFGALFLEFTTPGIACYVEVGYHAATEKAQVLFIELFRPCRACRRRARRCARVAI